jgi:hypothetical protein
VQYEIEFVHMPLAVYREVAAHLRQVDGVDTELLPQTATTFDYNQSQIGGLRLELAADSSIASRQQVVAILNHYQERYPLSEDNLRLDLFAGNNGSSIMGP